MEVDKVIVFLKKKVIIFKPNVPIELTRH